MATANGNSKCTIEAEGRVFYFYFSKGGDNLLQVDVELDGVLVGTPVRFKGTSNGMIAADFPGVSSDHFATDSDGHVTNG